MRTNEVADKIIYIESGSKVAEGTRDELYEKCLGFRLMWDTMFRKEHTEKAEEVLALTE